MIDWSIAGAGGAVRLLPEVGAAGPRQRLPLRRRGVHQVRYLSAQLTGPLTSVARGTQHALPWRGGGEGFILVLSPQIYFFLQPKNNSFICVYFIC